MKSLLSFAVAATLVTALWAPAQAQSADAVSPTVVELFTSQGCSSCPPADAYLGRLAERDDLIALSFHVDYWDYIGWKDTFASPESTDRQRGYATAMGDRRVYTPQMVIGGMTHAVGSDRRSVERAIEKSQQNTGMALKVRFRTDENGRIVVRIPAGHFQGDASVWLAIYDKKHDVDVRRGENAGRKLSYYNVVREVRNLGLWRGREMEIALSPADLNRGGPDGCVVIVQRGMYGPVLGAAKMELGRDSS